MKIIPAVDLLNGHAVQLRGGDPETRLYESPHPVQEAQGWIDKGADRLHIVDLDRVLDRGDNTSVIDEILGSTNVPVHVGGGLRGARAIRAFLEEHDRAHAVVATRAWQDPAWLDHVTDEFPDRIIVALELKQGTIAVRGWTERTKLTLEEGLHRLQDYPLSGVLFTDIDREGKLIGPNLETTRKAAEELDVPLIASGGISTTENIQQLKEAGAWGCVIGTALYTGELEFSTALEAASP